MKKFIIGLVLLTFLVAGTAGAADLDLSRLLLYWPCDENGGDILEDESGNGFNAEIGGNHGWEEGQFGGAVSLQSTSATVVGDVVSSTAETGEITMACWFLLRAHTDYSGVLSIANPGCDASCCYRMLINPGFSPFWNGGQHSDKSIPGFVFETGTWYHYVMVVSDGMDKIYVDGELIGEEPGIDPPEFDEVTVLLGAGEGPGTHMIEDGIFDEAMIWDAALDEDQIGELMDGGYLAIQPVGKLAFTWGKIKQQ